MKIYHFHLSTFSSFFSRVIHVYVMTLRGALATPTVSTFSFKSNTEKSNIKLSKWTKIIVREQKSFACVWSLNETETDCFCYKRKICKSNSTATHGRLDQVIFCVKACIQSSRQYIRTGSPLGVYRELSPPVKKRRWSCRPTLYKQNFDLYFFCVINNLNLQAQFLSLHITLTLILISFQSFWFAQLPDKNESKISGR